jgi:small subunit ribosomal protein S19
MRSKWKGPFIDYLLLRKKRFYLKDKKKNPFRLKSLAFTLRSRRSTILPFFEGVPLKIYNGNKYVWVSTKLQHIGHKIGDFALTKKKCFIKKKQKK